VGDVVALKEFIGNNFQSPSVDITVTNDSSIADLYVYLHAANKKHIRSEKPPLLILP
jgi:hypothetical protein